MNDIGHYAMRRVVITGLGVVAPNGVGKAAFWDACLSGRSGIRRITRFDASSLSAQIAGDIPDFDPLQLGLTADEVRVNTRGAQLGLAAAIGAIHDAELAVERLSTRERESMGVSMGSAMEGAEEGERTWAALTNNGTMPVNSALLSEEQARLQLAHPPAQSIAAHYRLHGPSLMLATGCSAGADAIGEAFWLIQEGRADRMLAGGSDSAIFMLGLDVFCIMGALSTNHNATPERASRPYDGKRDGFVMAEGAGVILLEERELALARGAHIYAEIVYFASNSNAYHMTSLPSSGEPLQRLLRQTLRETALEPSDLDYINSHGSSTAANDHAETNAYKAVFGQAAYGIPISSTKSLIGHTQGAASAIETVVTALAVDQQILPPTINQEHADSHCDLDYVPNVARQANVRVALTHSSGFGGVNSVLILTHPDWANNYAA